MFVRSTRTRGKPGLISSGIGSLLRLRLHFVGQILGSGGGPGVAGNFRQAASGVCPCEARRQGADVELACHDVRHQPRPVFPQQLDFALKAGDGCGDTLSRLLKKSHGFLNMTR